MRLRDVELGDLSAHALTHEHDGASERANLLFAHRTRVIDSRRVGHARGISRLGFIL